MTQPVRKADLKMQECGRSLTGGKYVPLVLDELLDEAPVTCARSYGGPLLPPMMLREPIPDFPLDIPIDRKHIISLTISEAHLQTDDITKPHPPGSELDSELGCGTYPSGTDGPWTTKSLVTVSPSSFICGQRTRWHTK